MVRLFLGLFVSVALSACGESDTECIEVAYADKDGDGIGDVQAHIMYCPDEALPSGYVETAGDCDDNDASRYRIRSVREDLDGDGYVGSEYSGKRCVGDPTPPVPYEETDCDDSDPNGQQLRYPDGDGDGLGGTDAQCVRVDNPHFVAESGDCDDTDANLQTIGAVDSDGDGYGWGEPRCIAADTPDLAKEGGDCDDDNPDIHPGAPEEWFDGVDSDCELDDNPKPKKCVDAPSAPFERVEIDPSCEGKADLAVAVLATCIWCGLGDVWVVVANLGTVAAPAGLEVDLDRSGISRVSFDSPIKPGELSEVVVGKSDGSVLLNVSPELDCNLSNNATDVSELQPTCP